MWGSIIDVVERTSLEEKVVTSLETEKEIETKEPK